MLAVPCVERSGRQRSAKPTRFVVWPASNTIFTCVNVAATQSCTPCSSLSMSKGVKLGSCWYSLFSTQHFSKTLYWESACTLKSLIRSVKSNGTNNARTPRQRVPQRPLNLSLHGNFKPWVRTKANGQPQWHLKIHLSVSCTRPLGTILRHFWKSWNPSWTAHAFRHTRHHTQ